MMQLRELLRECKKNSLTAQKCLYDQLAGQMFLLCRRYVRSDEIAEEVMMNGFLCVFRSLNNFSYLNDAAAVGWMRRIMVNECLMHLRSSNSFLQLATDEIPEIPVNEDALGQLAAEEIFRMVTKLPPGYRTVFNLSVVEGFSHGEIAELLGITEGTSRSQLNRARQLMQQMLIQNNSDYAWRKTK
jgi:RNA polymerase sigma factor (sigma-70 family)